MNTARSIFATPGGTTAVGPHPLTTPPFPARHRSPFRSDYKLQRALDDAIAKGPGVNWPTPVCIVALSPTDGQYPVAAFRPDEVHYAASLVKVAALYAAFELRNTLRAIAQELGAGATTSTLLSKAAAYLNPRILAKVQDIKPLHGVTQDHALPQYAKAFHCVSGDSGVTVNLSGAFQGHLKQMISLSVNQDAAACIHGLGYGYLNGTLASAGFFDLNSECGIWLAGDYTQKYPYYRIDSVNDRGVAQAATVLQLAKLFTLLFDHTLVDAGSSDEMLNLLTESVTMGEVYIRNASNLDFHVTHCKLGYGPLKSGSDVSSETAILAHNSGAQFVAAWQNFPFPPDWNFNPIAHVVRDTIDAYLAP